MNLEYAALALIVVVAIVLFYAIIAVHDIPYGIAKKRNHPHAEAIHYGGWISMFTLHAIWPLLWIWATIYDVDRGYGFSSSNGQVEQILRRLEVLEKRVAVLRAGKSGEE